MTGARERDLTRSSTTRDNQRQGSHRRRCSHIAGPKIIYRRYSAHCQNRRWFDRSLGWPENVQRPPDHSVAAEAEGALIVRPTESVLRADRVCVSVMVAKPDLAAFKSIPTDSSGAEITLYGRVEYDGPSKFRFLRLVGRNATTDSAGNATLTW